MLSVKSQRIQSLGLKETSGPDLSGVSWGRLAVIYMARPVASAERPRRIDLLLLLPAPFHQFVEKAG